MQPLRGGTVFTCQNPGHLGKRCPTDETHPLGGHADPDPTRGHRTGFLYLILVTLGLVWEGVVAYIILRQEVEPFTWVNIKDRVWLHTPTNPKTGVPSNWLFLRTIPLIVVIEVGNQSLDPLNGPWVKTFPFLAPPPLTVIQNLAEPALRQWWLLSVLAVMIVFNYLLGRN